MKPSLLCRLFVVAIYLYAAKSYGATVTTVTTYVTETQDKRESTRFTLTEWLRIKERMKMMDVWLAMFGKPESKFEPEIFLGYGVKKGNFSFDSAPASAITSEGSQAKLQLWLTNLVSSSTGIRTLNIDFGLEGFANNTYKIGSSTGTAEPVAGKRLTTQGTVNFRLFGKSIQDSYFVLKGGTYSSRDQSTLDIFSKIPVTGTVAGGEIALYLFKWLGVKGNYYSYGTKTSLSAAHSRGSYYDYQAYIEISILRLMAGRYQENFVGMQNGTAIKTTDSGQIVGVEMLF